MKIALGVTGCIAAYKAVEVMRGLQKSGIAVQVILTRSARRFVGAVTFEALSAQSVITSMWRRGENRTIQHIQLAQEVALLVVAPATANILGKFAHGLADDFLSTFYLSCPAPVLLAPAMNVEMWRHPAVRANVRMLEERGHHFVYPETGSLACGMEGPGRLAEVDSIVNAVQTLLSGLRAWEGLRVLVTAGPTVEDIDPVRFISNRSSGKMGYALAEAALRRGAEVHLVSGPSALLPPARAKVVHTRSAAEMHRAVLELFPRMHVVVMAAAVSDYYPAVRSESKIKKEVGETVLQLLPTHDILAELGRTRQHQILIGFAAETEDLLKHARQKLQSKNLDAIVANDVSQGVFGEDLVSVHILTAAGQVMSLSRGPKTSIAESILDCVDRILADRGRPAQSGSSA